MFSVGEPLSPPPSHSRTLHRHALTQPIPNLYEGSFNSNLPFRDCSESCIFLSRTNVYHSITNRETFVPVSRPTFHLPARVDRPGIIRYFLRPRYILARPENPTHRFRRLHSREFNFNFDFFDDCVRARSWSHSTLNHEHFNWSFPPCEFERHYTDFLLAFLAFRFTFFRVLFQLSSLPLSGLDY